MSEKTPEQLEQEKQEAIARIRERERQAEQFGMDDPATANICDGCQ